METRELKKDSKSAVLYFKPESIARPEGARCGACWKFVRHPGACIEVRGHIEAEKVCGLYVHGRPFEKNPGFSHVHKVSQSEAGYGDGDTHCENCEYMMDQKKLYSPCDKVEGLIEPKGCCNEHEHDDNHR